VARKVLIVTHGGRVAALQALDEAREGLKAAGFDVVEHIDDHNDEAAVAAATPELRGVAVNCELVMVLGGDGSILRAAEFTYGTGVPILGVNLGHVGFLAEAEREALSDVVDRVVARDISVEERTVAEITVMRPGETEPITSWAVNEASVEKANRTRLIEIGIEVDDQPLSSFGTDGVVVATATGSTAYAFSAGGPILWPDLDALLLVPLAAHALFVRPLVIGPKSSFRVTILPRSPLPAVVNLDGRRSIELPQGSTVEVRIGDHPMRFARLNPGTFTSRLVSKFQLPVVGWREAADDAAAEQDRRSRLVDALQIPMDVSSHQVSGAEPSGHDAAESIREPDEASGGASTPRPAIGEPPTGVVAVDRESHLPVAEEDIA
jgi:NAD+ kinase